MTRLVGLVKPLIGYMILAITMGLVGHLCAAFITVLGGYAVLHVLHPGQFMNLRVIFSSVLIFAILRGFLRYAEQACNHFIAFKLLALIRDKVFGALRRLCPAKLEGKDKGNLISIITSDIELLEVFYAHTISPICIAALFCGIMVAFIGSFHIALGVLTLVAHITVGVIIPLLISKFSGEDCMKFRAKSGEWQLLFGLTAWSFREFCSIARVNSVGADEQKTDELSNYEGRMKRIAGRNTAAQNCHSGVCCLCYSCRPICVSVR